MVVSEAFPGDEAGAGPGILNIEQESIRRAVTAPGVTFVLGPAGSGKTKVALQVVRDLPTERVFAVTCWDAGSLDEIERQARTKLETGLPGAVVILDGLDDLPSAPSLERLTRFTQALWLGQAHVLLLSRTAPEGLREAFRKADTPQRHYSIIELRWSYTSLISALWAAADRGRQHGNAVDAVVALLESAARHPNVVRALMSAVQSQLVGDGVLAPDLMFVPDRSGLIRVLPSTGMELTGLEIAPGRVIAATPWIAYKATRDFWLPDASELEELINDPAVREADLQEFFERHPHLLAGTSYDRVVAHPVLARDQDGPLVPDFMLEPVGGGFADVLDLKLPSVRLIVGRKDRVRLSAHVAEALSQVREYRAYFEDSRRRQAVRERYGLQAYRPTAAVLIGRDPGPGQDKFELKRLWDELPGHVRIITYDELLRQVRSLGRF